MILQHLTFLNKKKIYLGSNSPRRIEILKMLGLNIEILKFNMFEVSSYNNPIDYVEDLAKKKAAFGIQLIEDFDLLITADTIVYFKNQIIEKPKNKKDALRIISELSGNQHQVYTSVALTFKNYQIVKTESTKVTFSKLNSNFINSYIDTNIPYDKAGAYGVQEIGASFVNKINGCFYNVMGFPANLFCRMLIKAIDQGRI